jgi:hypothetical protein
MTILYNHNNAENQKLTEKGGSQLNGGRSYEIYDIAICKVVVGELF